MCQGTSTLLSLYKYTVNTNFSAVCVIVKGVDCQRQTVDVEKRLLVQRPVHAVRYVHLRDRHVKERQRGIERLRSTEGQTGVF